MAQYHLVTVKESFETERGVKTKTKRLLVDSVSPTEAEAKATKLYEGSTVDFEVTGAVQSNISEVVL